MATSLLTRAETDADGAREHAIDAIGMRASARRGSKASPVDAVRNRMLSARTTVLRSDAASVSPSLLVIKPRAE